MTVFAPGVVSAAGYDSALYQAFDHHLPADRRMFTAIKTVAESIVHFDSEISSDSEEGHSHYLSSLKAIVDAAYQASCQDLPETLERESCEDLVKVMLLPGEPLKTAFGRKMQQIFVNGDFSSSEGRAIAMALCIDPTSLDVTLAFDEMKSGGHDRELLPWFRFYAKEPELLKHVPFLFQLMPEPMILQLNREIYESWQLLALAYHGLAHGKIQYPEYFKAYRRHFQAIHARETVNRALSKVSRDNKRMSYLAIYNRGLFGVSQEYSRALKDKSFSDVSWVRDWLNAPYRVITFHKDFKDGNVELEGAALETLKRFQLNEANNLLSHWNSTLEGSLALLALYEEGFGYLPATSAERERYSKLAVEIRAARHWESKEQKSLSELSEILASR